MSLASFFLKIGPTADFVKKFSLLIWEGDAHMRAAFHDLFGATGRTLGPAGVATDFIVLDTFPAWSFVPTPPPHLSAANLMEKKICDPRRPTLHFAPYTIASNNNFYIKTVLAVTACIPSTTPHFIIAPPIGALLRYFRFFPSVTAISNLPRNKTFIDVLLHQLCRPRPVLRVLRLGRQPYRFVARRLHAPRLPHQGAPLRRAKTGSLLLHRRR